MAKRDGRTTRVKGGTNKASRAATADATEARLVAFAEQLGRIAGTVQARVEGWMDREALTKQITTVRDGAADLLKQLAVGARKTPKKKPAARATRGGAKPPGAAGDSRGKRHRKPLPSDPDATIADSQAAKMRAAKTMVKTKRLRGRG